MKFKLFLYAAQNGNCLFHIRFTDIHGLKTAGQSGIFFDILFILIQRRRPEAMQFTAGQSRFQKVRRIHGALAGTGTDQGMHFINKKNNAAVGGFNIFQYCFQALFKLTAELCTGNQCAQVQSQQTLAAQAFRHVVINDAHRQPLNNGRFADARLTYQNRIVFGTA